MAGAETLYTFVIRGTAFFERGRGVVSSLPVERDGETVAPTEADCTYQLLDPSGNEVVEGTVVVNADDVAEVTLDASDLPATLALGVGYQERWGLALDGNVHAIRREVVLGKFELMPPIAHQDLLDEYPDILVDLGGFGSTLQPYMDGAWRQVVREFTRHGDFPDIVCEPSDVYDWYRQAVWERVFRSLAKTQASNNRWKELWDHHREAMALARQALQILVDRDRDGRPDSLGREAVAKSYHINVPTHRRPRWDPRW